MIAQRYIDSLAKIRQGLRDSSLESDVKEMRVFFIELLQQGTRRRQSFFATEESPSGNLVCRYGQHKSGGLVWRPS
jgi:hypothetical protein